MTGWTAVQRDVYINYDLENSPLQIKTDSLVGSNEIVGVYFYTSGGDEAGEVLLSFTSPPKYWLVYCSTSWTKFLTALPSETDKVWTLTLSRTSGTVRLTISCNNEKVLNVVFSDTICGYDEWSNWKRDVEKIKFVFTASDYYRPGNYKRFFQL